MANLEDDGSCDAIIPVEKAMGLCRDFLQGAWSDATKDKVQIQRISGGLSNHLFLLTLAGPGSSSQSKDDDEPSKVLLRVFGRHLKPFADLETTEKLVAGIVAENVIFAMLSERKLGPRILGVFGGGRLEEYVPSETLVNYRIRDPACSLAIARKLAQIHHLRVPISKDPNWLLNTITSWNRAISKLSLDNIHDPEERKVAESLIHYDFDAEVEWLKNFLPSVDSPVVFSHNDLQGGNILLREAKSSAGADEVNVDSRLVFIDFEFCSYTYRAFDIANHWSEWEYDYGNANFPYFHAIPENYPTDQEQESFLRAYCGTYLAVRNADDFGEEDDEGHPEVIKQSSSSSGKSRKQRFHSSSMTLDLDRFTEKELEGEVLKLKDEVRCFLMMPHLLWGFWALRQALEPDIVFGYLSYAKKRLDRYFALKQKYLKVLEDEKIGSSEAKRQPEESRRDAKGLPGVP